MTSASRFFVTPAPQCWPPIDSSNGNKHLTDRDYQGGGAFPLVFERYYNSSAMADTAGSLGKAWRSNLDRRIRRLTRNTNKAYVVRADGLVHYYTFVAGKWIAEKDVNNVLTRQADSADKTTGWTLQVGADDSVETYNAQGNLISIKSRTGQLLTLTLSDAATPASIAPKAGLPIALTDHFNRKLNITWDSASRIASVTTPDNDVYRYSYDSDSRLTKVTYPALDPVTPSKQYRYNETTYTSGASLRNAITGAGWLAATRPQGMSRLEERHFDRQCKNTDDPCRNLKATVATAISDARVKMDAMRNDTILFKHAFSTPNPSVTNTNRLERDEGLFCPGYH
jgi:YD repeat-containing protein